MNQKIQVKKIPETWTNQVLSKPKFDIFDEKRNMQELKKFIELGDKNADETK